MLPSGCVFNGLGSVVGFEAENGPVLDKFGDARFGKFE